MPQIVKKRRSGWAILAVGALVASLLAVGSAPAGAAEIKTGDANTASAEVKPAYKACVGDALEDAGFTDLGTLEDAARDINCLKYYKITTGKTDDTFDPNSNVTRSQMALFLYRAASAAGVDLMGGDGDADFGDIADLGEDRQIAIKALARNNILAGRSDMAFDPSGDITRAEMAVALVGLLRHANSGLFSRNGSLKDVTELDHFADARAAVPRAVDSAISQAYELGITTGRDDATFAPNDGVPRRNMASFIIRTLAHTNLRPAGVSVQLDATGAAKVSVRSADFQPVANARVDAFWREAARAGEVIQEDGTCSRLAKSIHSGATACAVDAQDRRTDGEGNVLIPGTIDASKGASVWAWEGAVSDTFDADDTAFVRLDIPVTPSPIPATSASVTSDQAKDITLAEFGDEVTFTVQLLGTKDGRPVPVGPPQGGASYRLLIGNPDRTAVASVLRMAADGSASFALTWGDPDPRGEDDAQTVTYTLVPLTNARGTVAPDCDGGSEDDPMGCTSGDPDDTDDREMDNFSDLDDVARPDDASTTNNDESRTAQLEGFTGTINFDDDEPIPAALSVDAGSGYAVAPARGNTTNTVTVTVTDQYGNGLGNIPVKLDHANTGNPDANADFDQYAYTTNSDGETAISYDYSGNIAATQTFDAYVADADNNKPTSDPIEADPDITFLWVVEPALTDGVSTVDANDAENVIGGDLDLNTIIVDSDAPIVLVFDSNDQFTVIQTGNADGAGTRYGQESFVADLSKDASLSGKGDQNVTVSWGSYDPTDSARVTQWTLNIEVTTN